MKIINIKMIKKLLLMTGMITFIGGSFIGVMTYINIGFTDDFFYIWFKSLFFAVLVMMPLGGIIMFTVNKIVKMFFSNLKEILQNVLIGLFMAFCMEAIMAISTTINIIGFTDISTFSNTWIKSYLTALPLALVLSPLMTIVIKPKVDNFLAR